MQRVLCNYCGRTIKKSEIIIFLHYLLGRTYYVQCPHCLNISSYYIRLWLVHDTLNETEKWINKNKR